MQYVLRDEMTKEIHETLDEINEQVAGRPGTPAHRAVREWMLAGVSAGGITCTSEGSPTMQSTVTAATKAGIVRYWEGKKDMLAALSSGTTAAAAVVEGARTADNFRRSDAQARTAAEIDGGGFEMAYLFMDYVLSRQADPAKYIHDIETDQVMAAKLQGRSLWHHWELLQPGPAPDVPVKASKKRAGSK